MLYNDAISRIPINIAYDHIDMTKGFISFLTILIELVKTILLFLIKYTYISAYSP